MDIWIIQDGEKSGPIHDFEIRHRIESGELSADTPAWHEGLATWRPLGEIDLFHGEFEKEKPKAATESPYASPKEASQPPPLPSQPHLIRRFWARWLDLYLFAGLWWLGMWISGRDIESTLLNSWIILFQFVPWFVFETILIHRYGTTPGKWLLGIKVVNDDGSLLSLAEATRRSARVLFIGIGFGWGWLALICQLMAWFTTRRIGRPLWDHAGGHRLATTPLDPFRIVGYTGVLFLALSMQMFVLFPFALKQAEKEHPEYSEQWKQLRRDFERIRPGGS
jgi:uncharacterized RDD family membrane protein YckC